MGRNKLTVEQVELIANSLLPSFIPKEADSTSVTFHFTTNNTNYRVQYEKKEADWKFIKYEEVE